MPIAGVIVKGNIDLWLLKQWKTNQDYLVFSENDSTIVLGNINSIIHFNIKELVRNYNKIARFILDSSNGNMLFDYIEEKELIRHILCINENIIDNFGVKLKPEYINKKENLHQKLNNLLNHLFNLSLSDFKDANSKINHVSSSPRTHEKRNLFFDLYIIAIAPKAILFFIFSPYLIFLLVKMIFSNESEVGAILIYPLVILVFPLLILSILINIAIKNRIELSKYVYNNKKIKLLTIA